MAILIGYGLALTAAYMSTHYQKFRRWGFLGGLVAILLALLNLKDAAGKLFFGVEGGVQLLPDWVLKKLGLPLSHLEGGIGWADLPHWIGQAFVKDQFGLPIFAYLILLASTIAFVVALAIYRQRAPLLVTLVLFAAICRGRWPSDL